MKTVGFSKEDIIISDDTSRYIIDTYTYEAGVRKLKELLFEIVREVNLQSIVNTQQHTFPFELTLDIVDDMLRKKHKIRIKSIHPTPRVGLINGLFATSTGIGGLTTIEVFKAYGQSFLELILTGSQGDVMKESIKCARTIAWNLLPEHHKALLKSEWILTKQDAPEQDYYYNPVTHESRWEKPDKTVFALHVHTPECGTPKDGPSAGAAITLAILSQLTNIPIKNDVAMTGEIDLNGNVTAIGGLVSKIQGALRAGVKKVLIPLENKPDLDDIIRDERIVEIMDPNIDFTVLTVTNIYEMLPHVLTENNIDFVQYNS